MMAPDSKPPQQQLSPASIVALRAALQAFLANEADTALKPALAAVADEAREKSIQAEQLLVVLKDVWYAIPLIESAPTSETQTRLLQRVVSLCIREYYSR